MLSQMDSVCVKNHLTPGIHFIKSRPHLGQLCVNWWESLLENTFTRFCCSSNGKKFDWDLEPVKPLETNEKQPAKTDERKLENGEKEKRHGILDVLKNLNFYLGLIAYGFFVLRLQSMVAWLSGGWPEWVVGGMVWHN